ncbi:hypothetical protein GH714_039751 [Hevea brasiliensis]|uniref:Pentacotripeptide-repeat region of PRORP domain-containing protein n=1 Tax=Hevea brasiliensis TaxID=3981 RepID=A0A6A6KGD5_HEVBR|nr:hypothetical protein GH714_039751 [Hevea brasiliensis]
MPPIFQQFKTIFWQNIYLKSKFKSPTIPTTCRSFLVYIHYLHIPHNRNPGESKSPFKGFHFVHSVANSLSLTAPQNEPANELAIQVQNIFKNYRDSPTRKIELALNHCCLTLTEDLILNVLRRHRSDWKPAFIFFNWVSKGGQIILGSGVYNEILDILGKMRRFGELNQVLDEMTNRGGLVNEETYRVLVNRYAAAHKVEEAIEGYKDDEYCSEWVVWLGNVHEAKRFWKDIVSSKCKPDLFTYGTFIKALTKKGKLGKAMKLYRAMWEKHCKPDVVICNCIIDALCFKKRIPEALEVFREMSELGCLPNVATYNSLIKHLCKIQRMEKVYELLDEMQDKKGSCMPNDITFNFLLQELKKPEQLPWVLERMERNE